jgi:GNAT superfamily N-acetyltransferase
MRAQEFLSEARSNPEQNVKSESGMKELEAVAKTIADPENWAISMTAEPKLGINPQVGISEDTPKGIYFYPLNYVLGMIKSRRPLPWGNDYPYIQLFQYDRSGEMTQQTEVDPAQLKQALSPYCSDEIIQQALDEPEYDGTPYWTIYDCLSRLGKGDETNVVRWNKVLRDLGFTSVFDPGAGWIAYNEPTQGVILDPRIIKQHKTIVNRKQARVVTPAKIEQAIFEAMDMELAADRAWQAYDPDGSKLRAAAKEYAKDPRFKPYMGKPGTEEIYDKASGLGRWGARQLSQEAREWYKAQQPVNEAFDQPYKLRWEQGDYGDVDAYAKMDDGNYLSIMFNKGYNQDKEEAWNVEFYRNNSQEVTGEGDAQRVFATVLSAIQKFIKKYKPNKVIFSASKEVEQGQNAQSRARLYDSLVQRYARVWGFRAFRADADDKVIYELSRIQPVKEDAEHYNGIEISLEKEDDEIMVTARLPSGRELGHVLFVQEGDYLMPQDLEVEERYQGQGIAATMYDYVKSKGYKIRRSGQQTDAGAGFWGKHRPEQNVWEQDVAEGFFDRFKKQLTADRNGIHLTATKDERRLIVDAIYNDDRIGNAIFQVQGKNLVAAGVGVAPEYQGKGIGRIMYDWVKELGYTLNRSPHQTDAGKGFWDKHKGVEQNVWEQDVDENFADGKKPGRKGLAKRSGVNCKQSVSKLRSIAAHSTGERQRMAHWCANMKSGKKKTNESAVGTLAIGPFQIVVDDHAFERAIDRDIQPRDIDATLKKIKLPRVAKQMQDFESGSRFYVFDHTNDVALGLRRIGNNRFVLKTVYNGRPMDLNIAGIITI